MACTVTDFRTRFPEFSDVTEYPDARIQMFLDDAVCYIGTNENYWCKKYNIAQCYLAAHLLLVATKTELSDSSSYAGPVSGKSAGGVSVTRSVVARAGSHADDFYISTSYGQQFIVIRNGCFVGIMVANCGS